MANTHEATTLATCAIVITSKMLTDIKASGATPPHVVLTLKLAWAILEHSDPDNPVRAFIGEALRGIKKGARSIRGKTVSMALRALSKIVDERPRPRTTPPQTTQSPGGNAGKRPIHKNRTVTTPPRTPQSPGGNAGKAPPMTRLPKVTGLKVHFKEPVIEVAGPIVGETKTEYTLYVIDDGLGITGINVARKPPNGCNEDCGLLADFRFNVVTPELRKSICTRISKIAEGDGSDIDEVLVFASDQVKGWFRDIGKVNARLEAKRHSEDDWGESDDVWE